MAGIDGELVRQPHEHVHYRPAQVVEALLRSADGAREERVAGEDGLSVDHEREHPARVPGRPQGLDAEIAGLDHLPVAQMLGAVDALVGRREHAQAVAAFEQLVVGHVVAMRVGGEQVRRVHLEAVDGRQQRLDGRSRVDEDGSASGAVRHEIGVGEPLGIHAPLDDHRVGSMPPEPGLGGLFGWPAS